jgi:hypothetical protein
MPSSLNAARYTGLNVVGEQLEKTTNPTHVQSSLPVKHRRGSVDAVVSLVLCPIEFTQKDRFWAFILSNITCHVSESSFAARSISHDAVILNSCNIRKRQNKCKSRQLCCMGPHCCGRRHWPLRGRTRRMGHWLRYAVPCAVLQAKEGHMHAIDILEEAIP